MRSALVILVAALCVGVTATSGMASAKTTWYWTPGACKAELQQYGVSMGEGRNYNVSKAYCVGLHNRCWLERGVRRYTMFIAVVRSYDGVVRLFRLKVTGKDNWTGVVGTNRITERYMSMSQFVSYYGNAAWGGARSENEAGCWH